MAAFPSKIWKALQRNFERIDNTLCVAIFLVTGMPAIVVMCLLSVPLLPFFGILMCMGGSTRLGVDASNLEAQAEDAKHDDHTHHPAAPTPRYA